MYPLHHSYLIGLYWGTSIGYLLRDTSQGIVMQPGLRITGLNFSMWLLTCFNIHPIFNRIYPLKNATMKQFKQKQSFEKAVMVSRSRHYNSDLFHCLMNILFNTRSLVHKFIHGGGGDRGRLAGRPQSSV